MKQPRTRIATTIADRTLQRGMSKQFGTEVAAYLLSERRVSELDSILRDVQADWAAAGQVEVMARSAHTLTASIKAEIVRQAEQLYPGARQLIVTEIHDPTIIGGVQLSFPNQQLDLSVEAKLNQFKQLTATRK